MLNIIGIVKSRCCKKADTYYQTPPGKRIGIVKEHLTTLPPFVAGLNLGKFDTNLAASLAAASDGDLRTFMLLTLPSSSITNVVNTIPLSLPDLMFVRT
jgi:hypothetical protein